MFKYVNKKIKLAFRMIGLSVLSIGFINIYKNKFSTQTLDLMNIDLTHTYLNKIENNPFELIEDFNIQDYKYKRVMISLYNPPLTSKLFPKSNLYGHELIRYFDF
jgi:hypothetical protein